MLHTVSDQLNQTLVFFGCGGICGVVLALRRICEAYTKPPAWRRFVGDCLFCVITLLGLFLVALAVSVGELRMITIGFTVVGCCVLRTVCLPLFSAAFRLVGRCLATVRHQSRRILRRKS